MATNFNQPNQIGYNNQFPYNSNFPYMNMGQQQYQINNQPQTQQQYLKCVPVSSREQAMACQIDLNGSLWVFPNVANGKIYTKQINNDGTATFYTYVFTKEEQNLYNSNDYVTKNEFNKVIQSLMAAIQSKNPQTSTAGNHNQVKESASSNFGF